MQKEKAEGDPFIVRGGYRCRHRWLPINRNLVYTYIISK